MLGVRVLRRTVILWVLCTEKGGEDELRGGSWFVHQAVPAAAVGAEHSLQWSLALVCLLTAQGGSTESWGRRRQHRSVWGAGQRRRWPKAQWGP